jgi:hypothetical protein
MGEARRKAEADWAGEARPRDTWCPGCGSKRLHVMAQADLARFGVDCDWHGCLDCGAVWEAFPQSYARDPVASPPCDNCAFRPGSHEQADPEHWRNLLVTLKLNADDFGGGRFFCHKGVPIDMTKGPGNFRFPRKPVLMDGKPLLNPDGSTVTTEDTDQMRTCSGFLRMLWAQRRKRGLSMGTPHHV